MGRTLVSLSALLFGVLLLVGGQGQLGTLLALRLQGAGTPDLLLALVLASWFAGWIAGCLRLPRLIRRVGHIRTFAALGAGITAVALLHGLVPLPWGWIPLRFLNCLCYAGVLLTVESWLALRATGENRGRVLSAYMIVYYLAFGGGQLLLGGLGTAGSMPWTVTALLFVGAVLPVALTRSEAPAVPPAPSVPFRRLARRAASALVCAFASGVLTGSLHLLAPVVLRRQGLGLEAITLWMGVALASGLLLQAPVGWLSDRGDRRTTTAAVAGCVVPVALLLAGEPPAWGVHLLLAALYGALLAVVYPLAVAHAFDRLEADEAVDASATLVLVASAGALVGPLLASAAMTVAGDGALFALGGAVAGLLAAFLVVRTRVRMPASAPEAYVPLVRTTAATADPDPRVPGEEGRREAPRTIEMADGSVRD